MRKTLTLAAALLGGSFLALPASAAPMGPVQTGIAGDDAVTSVRWIDRAEARMNRGLKAVGRTGSRGSYGNAQAKNPSRPAYQQNLGDTAGGYNRNRQAR